MTEFTFAPGEKNIIGDRFSPSVIIFWLKTSIAASSTRIQYTTPNTLFGLIPLGADTKTIPLRNVASVDTSTKFNLGSPVWGVVFLLIGLGCLDSSVIVASILIRAFAEWILERPTRAERRAMKRAAAQETGRVTMRMPVSEEVAAAFESTRDGRRASL